MKEIQVGELLTCDEGTIWEYVGQQPGRDGSSRKAILQKVKTIASDVDHKNRWTPELDNVIKQLLNGQMAKGTCPPILSTAKSFKKVGNETVVLLHDNSSAITIDKLYTILEDGKVFLVGKNTIQKLWVRVPSEVVFSEL
jgi:hypothetical protein